MPLADTEDDSRGTDLDSEEEFPYRRREKVLQVRRSGVPRRARRVLKWLLFAALVALPAGFGGYAVATYALNSSRFNLISPDDIVVEGNRFVTRDEVLSALGLPLAGRREGGVNVFGLSLEEKRRQVESLPWVRSASLTRAFPHRLAVHIVERTPVAFVNLSGRVKLVDGEGVLMEKPEKATFDFPVLEGLEAVSEAADRRARLALYLDFMRQLADEVSSSGWMVSEVDLADADDLRAVIVQGRETIHVHFGYNDFLQRFHDFLALLPEMRKTDARIDSVDLRYRNQIVVSPSKVGASER